MPLHQEESSCSSHMGSIHAFLLCIIRLKTLLFATILIIALIRNGIWVRIHCRKLANWHIHHRGSASIQTKSIRDLFINLHHAGLPCSHDVSFRNRPIRIGLVDVRQPRSTQFMFELITQSIDTRGNGCALFLPDVIGDSEPAK